MTPLEEITDCVVEILRAQHLFITTVESCTGGALINAITDVVGASEVTNGGFVCYSNEQKIALGVPVETIATHSVYSPETAIAMAEAGIRTCVHADLSVGITGAISGGHTAFVAVAYRGRNTLARQVTFDNTLSRKAIKEQIVIFALKIVLARLGN